MAILGQDAVLCKIIVDNKCLQCLNISVVKFAMKMKRIFDRK